MMALQIVVMLATYSTYFYLTHRLFHIPYLFNKVHYVHHKITTPVGIAAVYAHPLEDRK